MIAALILVIGLWVPSPWAAQEVEFRPALKVGDRFTLEVTRTKEDSNRPATNSTVTTNVEVIVEKAGAEGFVLNWRPGAAKVLAGNPLSDPTIQVAAKIVGDMQYLIQLAPTGEFERVANYDDLLPKLTAALDAMMRPLEASLKADELASFRTFMGTTLSPANLVVVATRDAQSYVGLYGVAVSKGSPLQGVLTRPSPLGGEPLPATFTITLESADAQSAIATVRTEYDGAALVKQLAALTAKVGTASTAAELASLRMTFVDDTRVTYDRGTGLFREFTNSRRLESGDGRSTATRLDRLMIKLLQPPTR